MTYRPLPGITVRDDLASQVSDPALLLPAISRFVAVLHQKGSLFPVSAFRQHHRFSRNAGTGFDRCGRYDDQATIAGRQPAGPQLQAPAALSPGFRPSAQFGWTRFVESYLEAAAISLHATACIFLKCSKNQLTYLSPMRPDLESEGAAKRPYCCLKVVQPMKFLREIRLAGNPLCRRSLWAAADSSLPF